MGQQNQHWMSEPDIGSGEKSPAQNELEQEQNALGDDRARRRADDGGRSKESGEPSHMLRDGDHLARYLARHLDDGTFEAQVYVRLAREPELAETYIPVGSFPTAEEALSAAEDRAKRALAEQEF